MGEILAIRKKRDQKSQPDKLQKQHLSINDDGSLHREFNAINFSRGAFGIMLGYASASGDDLSSKLVLTYNNQGNASVMDNRNVARLPQEQLVRKNH